MESPQQRPWLAWGSVSLLALLCAGITVLQYRWIGEIAGAQRTRLQQALQSRLNNLSREFNTKISSSCAALMVNAAQVERSGREAAYSEQYARWRESHPQRMFQRIALAVPRNGEVRLSILDLDTGRFSASAWPAEWSGTRERLEQRVQGGGVPGLPTQASELLESPRFDLAPDERRPIEHEWLLLQLNQDYLRATMLPELLARYIEEDGQSVYEAEVIDTGNALIYSSVPGRNAAVGHADASVALFDIRPNIFSRRVSGDPANGPGRAVGLDLSREGLASVARRQVQMADADAGDY